VTISGVSGDDEPITVTGTIREDITKARKIPKTRKQQGGNYGTLREETGQ
jgi:hypothetical protein